MMAESRDDMNGAGDDETRLAPAKPAGTLADSGASSRWLSSSGDIDHGRFPPGTLLGGRYRIVGRLGRGGMGEVYRADDLKLGQAVALKFLPPEVDRDPARLTQLHTEVRMARQVSHPNVCRVYDIDEVDGHAFLSMEYVDGEDLSSLLRRIGRFPVDRAVDLSRQICAGLSAAHERGVVHRDFKPANVMVDGSGNARITDFGLAGAAGEMVRAGTPAYMAPEQLAGEEVTPRSDVYALGLVLYEIFTGRRAIEAKSLAELVRKREEAGIEPPSHLVPDLDPAVDRAVLRCLEREPAARPASARAVAAALPGGDPLAAALAAGETPSPEMVAAAGESSALTPVPAIALLVTVLTSLVLLALLTDRVTVFGTVPLDRPPTVLADRAVQTVRSFGYTDPVVDSAWGFAQSSDYVRYTTSNPHQVSRERLASGRPPALLFWHRTSPRQLVPTGDNYRVTFGDPPHTISGMTAILLDPVGRLVEFHAVPPQVEQHPFPAEPVAPQWDRLFEMADLRLEEFTAVAPQWTPRGHSDTRQAWEGPMPGWPETRLRVEAAAYRGRPVFFQLIAPWTRPARMETPPIGQGQWLFRTAATAVALMILLGSLVVARHNLRRGRGDRTGALRLAFVVFLGTMGGWIVGASHTPELGVEAGRVFGGAGRALWATATIWVLYIALEPYVRRFWPSTLISWSRLMAGGLRDARVGRDILIGCAFGCAITLIGLAHTLLLARWHYGAPLRFPRLQQLEGLRQVLASVGDATFNAPFNALWAIFGLVVLRLIFRRVWLTALAALLLFVLTAGGSMFDAGPLWLSLIAALTAIGLVLLLILRFGLLAAVVFFFFTFTISQSVLTLNPERWFFTTSAWILMLGTALAAYGFYASRGGEPLLGRRLLD